LVFTFAKFALKFPEKCTQNAKMVVLLPFFGDTESYKINLICVAIAKEAKTNTNTIAVAGFFMLQTLSIKGHNNTDNNKLL
jgi:hypothetical protein